VHRLKNPPENSRSTGMDRARRRRRIFQSRSDRPLRHFVPHIQERIIAGGRNSASAFPGRAVQR
jgi:hypothetical protein